MQKTKKFFRKLKALIKHPFSRKNEPLLHTIEWVFILLAFFAVGFPILYYKTGENIFGGGKLKSVGREGVVAPSAEMVKEFIGETVEEPVVDVTGWDTYRNQWYGFEIKHPDSWTNMSFRTTTSKVSRFETVYKFRKNSSGENDPYVGFDVAVYSTKKAASTDQTNDVEKKDGAPEDTSSCQFSEDLTLGDENNVFQKVSVSRDNACYEPTYFFSIKKDNYLFDIIPVAKDGAETPGNLEQDVNKNFPEYKKVASSLKFIPISRSIAPKAIPAKPRITARRPLAARGVAGRLVCPFKNDHPSYSKTKGHHMDEDCCMDPDESRNPWCSY